MEVEELSFKQRDNFYVREMSIALSRKEKNNADDDDDDEKGKKGGVRSHQKRKLTEKKEENPCQAMLCVLCLCVPHTFLQLDNKISPNTTEKLSLASLGKYAC